MIVTPNLQPTAIDAYVSHLLGELLGETTGGEAAKAARFDGVLLFLDIVGSSSMVEQFAAEGPEGAERLSNVFNRYFEQVFDLIHAHGGDVIRIHGDAVLAVWRGERGIEAGATAAARAAFALREALRDWRAEPGVSVHHRLALSGGPLSALAFHGRDDQSFFLVAGEPVQANATLLRDVAPDSVVIADALVPWLPQAELARLPQGVWHLAALRTDGDGQTFPALPGRRLSASSESLACRFLPPMLVNRVNAGGAWLAEFRVLSMVYVHLSGFECESPERLAHAIGAIDEAIRPLGVALFDVSIGDKGAVAQIACGLPPFAQERNAVRALQAAGRIRSALAAAGIMCSIGVSSGRAFCGDVGSRSRREFLLTGPVMHLGARMMQAAAEGILCDAATAAGAERDYVLSEQAMITVKGRREPLAVYRVDELRELPHRIAECANTLYGRDEEVQRLPAVFEAVERGQRLAIAIVAEPGAGKSRLLSHVAAEARARDCCVIGTATSPVEHTTAYYACRSLLQQLLLEPGDSTTDAAPVLRERLAAAMRGNALQARAALIEDILPLGMQDRALADQISGPARLASIEDLFVHLASRRASSGALVMLVDDVHWLDDQSARLLLAVVRRVPRVLLALATRPVETAAGTSHVLRLIDAAAVKVPLRRLGREAIVSLVRELLQARSVPPRLAEYIYARSEGLPFHAEQLTLSLRDQRALEVSDGRCRVVADLSSRVMPDNLRDLIVSRVDTLAPMHQIAAKIASAIGRTFNLEMLQQLFPSASGPSDLRRIIADLIDIGILDANPSAAGSACNFRHALIREAIYELLTFEQRQPLHQRIAEYIEERQRADLTPHYAELADHCERARLLEKAIAYRQLAAELAIARYANHDALSHVDRIEQLSAHKSSALPPARAAQLAKIRADACHELSRFAEAQEHFKRCAALSGIPVPGARALVAASALREAVRQAAHRIGLMRRAAQATRQKDRLTAHIYTRFAEHAYFTGDALWLVHGTLTSLNRAERVGAVAEIIEGYGGLAIGLGTAGLHRFARFYRDRAIARAYGEGRLHDQGFAHLLAAVYSFQAGIWPATAAHCAKGAEICGKTGDRFRYQSCRVIHAYLHILTGGYDKAEEMLKALGEDADEVENIPVRAWVLAGRAVIDMVRGRPPALAIARIASARDDKLHRAERLLCDGLEALAHLQAGDSAQALRLADAALDNMEQTPPTMGIALLSVAGVAEVHLTLAERAAADGTLSAPSLARARSACRAVGSYARKMPISRSRYLLLKGRLAALCGQPLRALRHWQNGLLEATRHEMPLEKALCLLAQAGSSEEPTERSHQYRQGNEMLSALDARPWLYTGAPRELELRSAKM